MKTILKPKKKYRFQVSNSLFLMIFFDKEIMKIWEKKFSVNLTNFVIKKNIGK